MTVDAYPHLKRFEKGKSGNPNGRPKLAHDIKTLAKQKGKAAFEKIIHLMETCDDDRVVLAAAKEVLDRAYGKVQPAADENDNRNVTINIVKYGEPDHAPQQLESQAVSIRAVEVPGGWGQKSGSGLSS